MEVVVEAQSEAEVVVVEELRRQMDLARRTLFQPQKQMPHHGTHQLVPKLLRRTVGVRLLLQLLRRLRLA